jgi:hypothetical protein
MIDRINASREATGDFLIRCTVSGGITGSRSAYLKVNGEVAAFATREAAEAEAARCRTLVRNNTSGARFTYAVEESRPTGDDWPGGRFWSGDRFNP